MDTPNGRKPWTAGHVLLATACALLGLAIGFLGFIDIFITVTHLLRPYWGEWSWTVIVLSEGSFTGAYLGWLLLDLRDKPPPRARMFLAAYLTAFGAGSVALNAYAGRDSFPDAVSHVIVPAAFFGYLIFVKILVKRLSADPAVRALETGLADARQYAIDLVRSQMGIWWRFRAPSLLRRQVLSGRLSDAVREDVAGKVGEGRTSGWESAVRTWVLGPDGLNLGTQAEAVSRQVREVISRGTPAEFSQASPRAITAGSPETPARAPAKASPGNPRRPSPATARKMSGEALAPYVRWWVEEGGGEATKAAVKRHLHVSDGKATAALTTAGLLGPDAAVVPLGGSVRAVGD